VVLIVAYASSLMAFPSVDYSTGQLSFSTPLVTVSGRKLSYTVSLRYNSDIKRGHVKSEPAGEVQPERAGWAGLGFEVETPYVERTIVGPLLGVTMRHRCPGVAMGLISGVRTAS
jgi:hypothetical protein